MYYRALISVAYGIGEVANKSHGTIDDRFYAEIICGLVASHRNEIYDPVLDTLTLLYFVLRILHASKHVQGYMKECVEFFVAL